MPFPLVLVYEPLQCRFAPLRLSPLIQFLRTLLLPAQTMRKIATIASATKVALLARLLQMRECALLRRLLLSVQR
jgi:hypothetical protein